MRVSDREIREVRSGVEDKTIWGLILVKGHNNAKLTLRVIHNTYAGRVERYTFKYVETILRAGENV